MFSYLTFPSLCLANSSRKASMSARCFLTRRIWTRASSRFVLIECLNHELDRNGVLRLLRQDVEDDCHERLGVTLPDVRCEAIFEREEGRSGALWRKELVGKVFSLPL